MVAEWEPNDADIARALSEAFDADPSASMSLREPRIGNRLRPDLFVQFPRELRVVEVKWTRLSTVRRVEDAVRLLVEYRAALVSKNVDSERVRLVLVTPGGLTQRFEQLFADEHIELWHEAELLRVLGHSEGPFSLRVRSFLEAEGTVAVAADPPGGDNERLQAELAGTACGPGSWKVYQDLVGEILAHLFCPPLNVPRLELPNSSKVNRRDIVIANYASSGFWFLLRTEYSAHHVVVDAKNSCSPVSKKDVLQLANYLNAHGAGLFGIIACRSGEKRSAEVTRREQWIIHRKLILVLTDTDFDQMLTLGGGVGSADEVLRQQIEDFRLSM